MAKFSDPCGKPFKFPQALLNMIGEVTGGNFIIFYDNMGEPDVKADFTNTMNELALRSYVTNFIGSINQAEEISSTQELLNSDMPPPPGFDPEEDSEFPEGD